MAVRLSPKVEQVKDLLSLFEDKNLHTGLTEAKKYAAKNVFNERRKVKLEIGAYNIIETLLDNMIQAAYEFHKSGGTMSFKSERILDFMGNERPAKSSSLYEKYLRVTDYLVGMTDNYATGMAEEIRGINF